ncbi:hypothetical protein VCR29J2_690097 [Vibrio coralliirubri]|nr:hypothetical protein VCR29J2_690097 [Vibrio coralliirubri]
MGSNTRACFNRCWHVETVVNYESYEADKKESAPVRGKDYARISRSRVCSFGG